MRSDPLRAGVGKATGEALRPRRCSIVGGLATDMLRSRSERLTENVLLRQQLIVSARKAKRPVFRRQERTLITLLVAALPRWRGALLLVKPETVLRWHSEGFRLLWRWKSQPTKPPVPRVSPDVVELIQAALSLPVRSTSASGAGLGVVGVGRAPDTPAQEP
jgi:hypothetical protein